MNLAVFQRPWDSRLKIGHPRDPSKIPVSGFVEVAGRVAFLPWLPVTLKSVKPKEMNFEPKTFGEHDKRCRLVQRLPQREAAKQLGVSPATILNWETGKTEPSVKSMPAILRWLGYDPYLEPSTLPERMLAKRRATSWSVSEARRLGVDAGTWGAWGAAFEFQSGDTCGRYSGSFRRHPKTSSKA